MFHLVFLFPPIVLKHIMIVNIDSFQQRFWVWGFNQKKTSKIFETTLLPFLLAKLKYFPNLDFPEIRGFALLNHHLGWGRARSLWFDQIFVKSHHWSSDERVAQRNSESLKPPLRELLMSSCHRKISANCGLKIATLCLSCKQSYQHVWDKWLWERYWPIGCTKEVNQLLSIQCFQFQYFTFVSFETVLDLGSEKGQSNPVYKPKV